MRYRSSASLLTINTGLPLQVMGTSSSLCTVTPSLVKIDMFQSFVGLPTLNNNDEKSVNVSVSTASLDNCGKGSEVTNLPLLVPPLVTLTCVSLICTKLGGWQLLGLAR